MKISASRESIDFSSSNLKEEMQKTKHRFELIYFTFSDMKWRRVMSMSQERCAFDKYNISNVKGNDYPFLKDFLEDLKTSTAFKLNR